MNYSNQNKTQNQNSKQNKTQNGTENTQYQNGGQQNKNCR